MIPTGSSGLFPVWFWAPPVGSACGFHLWEPPGEPDLQLVVLVEALTEPVPRLDSCSVLVHDKPFLSPIKLRFPHTLASGCSWTGSTDASAGSWTQMRSAEEPRSRFCDRNREFSIARQMTPNIYTGWQEAELRGA